MNIEQLDPEKIILFGSYTYTDSVNYKDIDEKGVVLLKNSLKFTESEIQ